MTPAVDDKALPKPDEERGSVVVGGNADELALANDGEGVYREEPSVNKNDADASEDPAKRASPSGSVSASPTMDDITRIRETLEDTQLVSPYGALDALERLAARQTRLEKDAAAHADNEHRLLLKVDGLEEALRQIARLGEWHHGVTIARAALDAGGEQ